MSNGSIVIGLALASVISAGVIGYSVADNKWQAKHSKYLQEQAQARAQAEANYASALKEAYDRADYLTNQLQHANATAQTLSEQLKDRVQNVSTVYIEKETELLRPLPSQPFTVGWVLNYNRALGMQGNDAFRNTAGVKSTTRTTQDAKAQPRDYSAINTNELDRSTVSQADVLENHIDNSLSCAQVRNQLNAILDLYEASLND